MMRTGKINQKDVDKLLELMPEYPKYHCVCLECEHEWDTDEEYTIQSHCPICLQGDILYKENYGTTKTKNRNGLGNKQKTNKNNRKQRTSKIIKNVDRL